MAGSNGNGTDAVTSEAEAFEAAVPALAAMVRLDLPAASVPGVAANMRLLQGYVGLIEDFPLDDRCEPAFGYVP